MTILSRTIQVGIISLAAFFMIWACCALTEATFVAVVFFGVVIVCALFYKKLFAFIKRIWQSAVGKAGLIICALVAAFGVFAAVFFSVHMTSHISKPLENINAVIVLGCRVKGEAPSSMLYERTRTAYELLCEYPEAVAVVSGGQGSGEDISEAEAMRRMLSEWGIEERRIIKEDKSTSTAENFNNSAEILRELGIAENVAIVTSEFHQYRASLYAKRSGLENTGHYSGGTAVSHLLNYWIREWAALAVLYILGY